MRLPPKTVTLDGGQPLALMYFDAAASKTSPITIGWVLFQPACPPRAGAGEVLYLRATRRTQLFILAPAPSGDTEFLISWTARAPCPASTEARQSATTRQQWRAFTRSPPRSSTPACGSSASSHTPTFRTEAAAKEMRGVSQLRQLRVAQPWRTPSSLPWPSYAESRLPVYSLSAA